MPTGNVTSYQAIARDFGSFDEFKVERFFERERESLSLERESGREREREIERARARVGESES
eukprot:1392673-Amorphochlora_amoeboformis.AAC.1